MRIVSLATVCALSLVALTSAPSQAAEWAIDTAASSVGFAYVENDERRTGRFGMIDPQLTLDPDNFGRIRGALKVSTASLDLGDTLREDILGTRPWLDSRAYPNAIFAVDRVVPGTGPDQAIVIGSLMIKSVSMPLSVPIRLTRQGTQVSARGALRFDRLDYGLRDALVENFVTIGDEIVLDFELVAHLQQ